MLSALYMGQGNIAVRQVPVPNVDEGDVTDVFSIMESGKWDISSIITHEFSLGEIEKAIQTAAVSFLINLLYALYNGGLGIVNRSLWFVTMCAYYTILSAMRFCAVLCSRKRNSPASSDMTYFVMKLSGVLLAVLSFVLTGVVYISLSENIAAKYDTVIMITIATYTFYKITRTVIRAIKQKKNPSPLFAVIRTIGCADVAVSVLTLQRSMLASFGEMADTKAHTMNILTGAAVCLFVLSLGIALILRGIKTSDRQKRKE